MSLQHLSAQKVLNFREKTIFLLFLLGIEPMTFHSQVWHYLELKVPLSDQCYPG